MLFAKRLSDVVDKSTGLGVHRHDASGGVSVEAHDMAVRRMVAAGAVPVTWLAVAALKYKKGGRAEPLARYARGLAQGDAAVQQRDWARAETAVGLAGVLAEHGGASGVAFAWEMQLLAGRARS